MAQDAHFTAVIFRKFSDGQIIALFPCEPADYTSDVCGSYMHVGQHGAASPSIIYDTKLAKPHEYADLFHELESEPYGCRLKVFKKYTSQHRSAHQAEQRRLNRRTA